MINSQPNNTNRRLPIKVLVVDDSPSMREFLLYLFASDQDVQVVGTANSGLEALEAVKSKKPDVITMDLHMPNMDGYMTTRAIMESVPTPIVLVTDNPSSDRMTMTLSALEAGALAIIKRPAGVGYPEHTATARELIQTVKLMSEVKVVKRWALPKILVPKDVKPIMPKPAVIKLVAIGSSTGGPLALKQLLMKLPKDFQPPLIIVQHIAQGFTEGLVHWLGQSSGFPVCMATHGAVMQPGHAYVAPNSVQATVNVQGQIVLKNSGPENGHMPSVSCLFRSVAAAYGADAVGILLTGMGKDGAAELGLMKAKGAITFAQDKDSSVIHGMPAEAIELGAALYVLPPDKISLALANLVNKQAKERASDGH